MEIDRVIEIVTGSNVGDMARDRPFNGQPHTDTGERGKTEIKGITFRDLRDCFIRAVCLSNGVDHPRAYEEARKGPEGKVSESDATTSINGADIIVVSQNLSCEVERLMGIFPNVPKELLEQGLERVPVFDLDEMEN